MARIPHTEGYDPEIYIAAEETKASHDFKIQNDIIRRLGIRKIDFPVWKSYDIIVDGLFGTGLSRNIEGEITKVIEEINKTEAKIISIDIPSGLNGNTGKVMGDCVHADYTLHLAIKGRSFGRRGTDYTGEITVKEIGFPLQAYEKSENNLFVHDKKDLDLIPKRKKTSHKGNYGKILVVAGSHGMCGAAYLSACAGL